jgi:hypothetical protein
MQILSRIKPLRFQKHLAISFEVHFASKIPVNFASPHPTYPVKDTLVSSLDSHRVVLESRYAWTPFQKIFWWEERILVGRKLGYDVLCTPHPQTWCSFL